MSHWQLAIIVLITSAISWFGGAVTQGADIASFFGARSRPAIYVVDGDTIKLGAQPLRLLNVDAPETSRPNCEQEASLGAKATNRLRALVQSGALSIEPNGKVDRYDRPLVNVRVNGVDVGQTLIGEGLARVWAGRNGDWCGVGS